MRISDWSSDVCSSDLLRPRQPRRSAGLPAGRRSCIGSGRPPRLRVRFDAASGACLFFEHFRRDRRGPCPGEELKLMSRRRQIYEGKAKILYEGPEPGTLIQYFKDDATAFNAQKQGTISGKGVLNNRILETTFTPSVGYGVPTHFTRRLNSGEQRCRQVEIIPLAVVIRNVAAGSLCKRLGVEEGSVLPRTILEYYYKDDALGDPLVTDEHIACFGWASQEELHDLADLAIRINDFLSGLFAGIGIRLVDFKLEFGRAWDGEFARILLADEISPDGCRLWDMKSNEKLDKDRFRLDLGGEVEAYQEIARRLGLLPEGSVSTVLDLEKHRRQRNGE